MKAAPGNELPDLRRARIAAGQVEALSDEDFNKYRSLVLGLPALIQTNGLAAALHFVAARTDARQRRLLDHLAHTLADAPESWGGEEREAPKDARALLALTRNADLDRTQALTREVQRCLVWYKRMVQGRHVELKAGRVGGTSP